MNVAQLRLSGFMSHAGSVIDFPRRGVVVVTGPNGAGKSSIPEGVSVAGWGRTLRGTNPWKGDAGEALLVDASGLVARRTHKKGKKDLDWSLPNADPVQYETTTKAQMALEAVIGSWDVWRRAAVFSSSDASHFTLATDAERKRLLEGILGLERFDVASDRARGDMAIANATVARLTREVAVLVERLDGARARVLDAERVLAEHDAEASGDPAALAADEQRIRADIAKQEAESKRIQGLLAGVRSDLAEAERAMKAAQRDASNAERSAALARSDAKRAAELLTALKDEACPTCEQPVGAAQRARLQKEAAAKEAAAEAAAKDAEAAKARADEEAAAASSTLEELGEERDALTASSAKVGELLAKLRGELSHTTANLERAKSAAAQRERLRAALADAKAKLVEVETAHADADEKLKAADKEHRTLEAVVRVLGTKGVRAHVLGSALAGLEYVANAWLARLGTGVALTVSAYTEKKTGGQSDAISLNLVGSGGAYGGGEGYAAASGGERRRVDVALLLALGEVAAAAHGAEPGTLFMDEVFDSLDKDGIERCCAALAELGQSRCVVVITHNEDLVAGLRADRHLIVEAGSVRAA